MNKESDKKVRIKVRLSEEENEKLKPQPQKEFWELLNALYDVHNSFQKCSKYEPSALSICKEIEGLILDLQEVA